MKQTALVSTAISELSTLANFYKAMTTMRVLLSRSSGSSSRLLHHYPLARNYCSLEASKFGNIGFIGLGNMGSRMVNNLIKAGYTVAVHDINRDAMRLFADRGILTMETPLEVAESSDVVITMLPSSTHVVLSKGSGKMLAREFKVLDVYSGKNGFLHGGNVLKPWLFIDSSTIDPQTSRRLSTLISSCTIENDDRKNPLMLDAPVSGGVLAAEAGTLTFMVGGSETAHQLAKPLLLSMGKSTIYCGGAGNGSAAKVCNNLAMAVSMLGVSEALALGQSLGISPTTLNAVFNSSSARCWSSDAYNPVPGVMEGVPSSRNYEGGFASKLMAKDLKIAAASAKEISSLKCPLTTQAQEIYTKLCEDGHEAKDFSCAFRHYYNGSDDK